MGGSVMCTARRVWPFLIALTLLISAGSGGAADPQASAPKPVPAAAAAVIPLPDVAAHAAAALNLLPTFTEQLAVSPQIQAILTLLPETSGRIEMDLADATEILRGQPSLGVIAAQQELWKERQARTTGWLNLLTQRGAQLQGALNQLAEMQATWRQTEAAARAADAPVEILQQIDAVLAALEGTEAPFRTQRAIVLGLQNRVVREVARCGAALAMYAQAQQVAMSGILARDSLPIWRAEQWAQARAAMITRIQRVNAGLWTDLVQYVQNTSGGMPAHVIGIVALMVVMALLRRRVRQWSGADEGFLHTTAVFKRPLAVAFMFPLYYLSSPYAALPPSLRQVFEVLTLAPALRVIQPTVEPRVTSELYTLMALFALDAVRQAYAGSLGPEQALLALEMLIGMAVLWCSLTVGDLRRASAHAWVTERLRPVRVSAGIILVVLAVGLAAGLLGYMRLARLLASLVLGGGALAVLLYAGFCVMVGLVAVALRAGPFQRLQMVRLHRDLLERRIHTAFRWAVIGGWTFRVLDFAGLLQPTLAFGVAVLSARLQRGSMSISLGDVADFILTVWVAYLVSTFLRFVLEEDVYPRVHLPRGISYAVSSLLNYVIVAGGFVLALGALGVDLTKLTILAGAFGVGIGFGLQSVVNNFVSGLILLFERPIHVGDSVEVGSISGAVRRIGIRASVVRTAQGAEIIVPNAQLITEQLTNWTLSDRLRRIDLPVGGDYGSHPRKVIGMLEAVARAHPLVLSSPAPTAFFTGYGDSAINYELRAWTEQFDQWYQIRSDLAAAVYDAGRAAGISFPCPQREIRLLRDHQVASLPTAFEPVPGGPGGTAASNTA
jgi:small-conductance mechanosensitive channel